MEVNRRLFFGFLGGAAASGKKIAITAEEALRNVKLKSAFDQALNIGSDSKSEACMASPISSIQSPRTKSDYWLKKLLKLKSPDKPKDIWKVANKRKLEIEGLRSVSYSHKLNMCYDVDHHRETEKEEKDIMQCLKNIAAGRDYYDDGED